MARPVTLFTGQWADLPLTELAEKASSWGYDGLELACWGDHFDPAKGAADPAYCEQQKNILKENNLSVYAISHHLAGQRDVLSVRCKGVVRLDVKVRTDRDPASLGSISRPPPRFSDPGSTRRSTPLGTSPLLGLGPGRSPGRRGGFVRPIGFPDGQIVGRVKSCVGDRVRAELDSLKGPRGIGSERSKMTPRWDTGYY